MKRIPIAALLFELNKSGRLFDYLIGTGAVVTVTETVVGLVRDRRFFNEDRGLVVQRADDYKVRTFLFLLMRLLERRKTVCDVENVSIAITQGFKKSLQDVRALLDMSGEFCADGVGYVDWDEAGKFVQEDTCLCASSETITRISSDGTQWVQNAGLFAEAKVSNAASADDVAQRLDRLESELAESKRALATSMATIREMENLKMVKDDELGKQTGEELEHAGGNAVPTSGLMVAPPSESRAEGTCQSSDAAALGTSDDESQWWIPTILKTGW